METNNTVLVISDKPQQFDMAVARLRSDGYRVRFEKNSAASFDLARVETPTLIVSELAVPDIDGLELCLNIRKSSSLRSTPILLIGDLSKGSSIVSDALRCGATEYVERPFDDRTVSDICLEMVNVKNGPDQGDQRGNLFDLLIQNISDAITIIDAEGLVLFASASTKDVLHFDSDELLGECFFDQVHPVDVREVREYFDSVHWDTRQPSEPIVCRIRKNSSSWQMIESIGRPINDLRFGAAVVITSRVLPEYKPSLGGVLSNEILRRAIFDKTPVAIAVFAESGHFIECNPALLENLEMSESQLRNRSLAELIFPFDADKDLQAISEMFNGKRTSYMFDNGYVSPVGERVWGRVSLVRCSGHEGGPDLVIGIFDEPDESNPKLSLGMTVLDFNDWKINKSLLSKN